VALAGLVGVMLSISLAQAQEQSEARGAGIAGGGLLGAELVTLSEALLGVRGTWAYVAGAAAGAGVGATGGWLAEEHAEPELSVLLLAVGTALAIPTVIWVGNALEPKPPTELPPRARLVLPACDVRFARGHGSDAARGVELRLRLVGAVW
jgi:hypothetical protein